MTTLPPPMLAEPLHRSNGVSGGRRRQRGVALLAMLTLLTLVGLYLFVGQLSAMQPRMVREQEAAAAFSEAKTALIGDSISRVPINKAGYLSLPDLGTRLVPGVGWVLAEGGESVTFPGDGKDLSVIGKFPWKTLDTALLRDLAGACLWYVVSGRFKNDGFLKTDTLNWDTAGQIDVIDANGSLIATNLAALVVAPGPALDGQSRVLADAAYSECGGNYDARNYLDSYDSADAIGGQVNYFAGSTNNRVAPNTSNMRFVMSTTDHYNDRFAFISVDDLFNPVMRRSDFAQAIDNLLDTPTFQTYLQSIVAAGNKGTFNIDCSAAPDPIFCANWKEMLFLTQISPPSPITINGATSPLPCGRVLIFAGRKSVGQSRSDALEKADKRNYLEGLNVSSFAVPNATATAFSGSLAGFSAASPATDLVRCLP
ncbi:MAG: hypothetical protein ABTS22_11780 [Accumulibacter sp.]|uniref:hypothetical protein n=1 Tax=Accumulibacter sp. TaxID=2053492 RepID=UPI0033154E2E